MLVSTVISHKQSTEGLCKYRSIKIRKQSIERSRSHQWVKLSYFCLFILTTEIFSICLRVAIQNRKTICGFIFSLLFLASGRDKSAAH